MLDLTDHYQGIGTELAELKAIGALMWIAGQTPQDRAPDLSPADLDNIGWTLRHLARRMEKRLDGIVEEHNRPKVA